jgi:hypothetical protein
MTPEEGQILMGLAEISKRCAATCDSQSKMLDAVKDLKAATKDVLSGSALYSQVSGVLHDLISRFQTLETTVRDLKGEMTKHNEKVDMLLKVFNLFYDKLDDYLKCPFPELAARMEKHGHLPSFDAGTTTEGKHDRPGNFTGEPTA